MVLAILCLPMAVVFFFGGWMAQESDGMLLISFLGVAAILVALGILIVGFRRSR